MAVWRRTSMRVTSVSRVPIHRCSCGWAIVAACVPESPRPKPGSLRRIVYDQISGADNGSRGSYFMGLPERHIEDVALRDVALQVGGTDKSVPRQEDIPEMRDTYPDAHMIVDAVPAFGLWARHVDGLTLMRVRFTTRAPDARPMVRADLDTHNLCTG